MATPVTVFYEFAVSGTDPSGYRHLTSHSSFVKQLGTSQTDSLDFGSVNIDSTSESDTKVVLFRVDDMAGNTSVYNMRFWMPEFPQVLGSTTFNMKIQNEWVQNASMSYASGQVPTSLPSTQNLFRGAASGYTENHTAISGTDDPNVSQWIYLNVTGQSDSATGKYGVGGYDAITYRVTFDYY